VCFFILYPDGCGGGVFFDTSILGGQGYSSHFRGGVSLLPLNKGDPIHEGGLGDRVSEVYARGWFELLAASLVPLDLGLKGARTCRKS
jgi:hypothetical protein